MGGCVAKTNAFIIDMQNSSAGFTGDYKLDWDFQRATIVGQLDVTWRDSDQKKGPWQGIPSEKKAELMALQYRAEKPDWEQPADDMLDVYKEAYKLFDSQPIKDMDATAAKKAYMQVIKQIEPRWQRLYYDATKSFAGLGEMVIREYTEEEKKNAVVIKEETIGGMLVDAGKDLAEDLDEMAGGHATKAAKAAAEAQYRANYNPNELPEGLVYTGGKDYWTRGCQPKFWKTFPYHKMGKKTLGQEMEEFAKKLKKWVYEESQDEGTNEWRASEGIRVGDEMYPNWIKHWKYVTEEAAAPATEAQKNGKKHLGEWSARTEKHHEGWTLQQFVNHPCCKSQGLIEEEVAAIRLYTGEGFGALGGVLRGSARHVGLTCESLTIFATCIMSACKKLQGMSFAVPLGYYYRGLGCALNYGIYTKMVEGQKQRNENLKECAAMKEKGGLSKMAGGYLELWAGIDLCMLENSVGSITPDIRIANNFSKFTHQFKNGKCKNAGCSELECKPSSPPEDVLCLGKDTVLCQMLTGYNKAARIDFLSQYTEQQEFILPPLSVFKTKSAVLFGKAVVLETETKFPDISEKPLPERFLPPKNEAAQRA